MTGDNKTPQWPADGPPAPAEPTPTRRKTRSDAAPAETSARRSKAAETPATPPQAAPPAGLDIYQHSDIHQPSIQPSAHTRDLRPGEFGNGNIFGEAFATLLDQVEAAKQLEREEEERAAQAALARALSDKLLGAGSGQVTIPPTTAPQPIAAQSDSIQSVQPTVTPPAPDFASRARAYAQTAPSAPLPSVLPGDSTQVYIASPAPAAPVPVAAPPSVAVPAAELHYRTNEAVSLPHHQPASQPVHQPLVGQPPISQPLVSQPLPGGLVTASSQIPSQDVPPEILAQEPVTDDHQPLPSLSYAMPSQVSHLKPKFAPSGPFLARFLPEVPSSHTGIQAGFCNLHDFLGFLHEQNWYGYLHAALGEQAAYVLVYEGRTVAAACLSSTGEQALGELLHLYEQGAHLSAYPLDDYLAHILSGVGSRAWKFNLTDDFTGLHAKPDEAAYYYQGRVVATMPTGLPYEGAFPAPLRPQTLVLPRSLAGWAHHSYAATLRGRDAVNAITPAHQMFKAKFGAAGLTLQAALLEGLTPAEYALRHDTPLHELEPVVHELVQLGYLKDE